MKKKNLLQDWEDAQREYYEKFNRSQVENFYSDWFGNEIEYYPYMEKYQMIDELIEDELTYREEDSVDELEDTIQHLNELILIK
tara:strand:+ start:42 stop:293 length:252 start_codon:yes stop_codon:yes gene_type:complete